MHANINFYFRLLMPLDGVLMGSFATCCFVCTSSFTGTIRPVHKAGQLGSQVDHIEKSRVLYSVYTAYMAIEVPPFCVCVCLALHLANILAAASCILVVKPVIL